MNAVERYWARLLEYLVFREAGEMTTKEEDSHMDALDQLWYEMTEDEIEEVNSRLRR